MDYADILNDVYKALADLTGALDVDHIPIEFLNKTFEDGATALDLMA
jgi:hypothetical protein